MLWHISNQSFWSTSRTISPSSAGLWLVIMEDYSALVEDIRIMSAVTGWLNMLRSTSSWSIEPTWMIQDLISPLFMNLRKIEFMSLVEMMQRISINHVNTMTLASMNGSECLNWMLQGTQPHAVSLMLNSYMYSVAELNSHQKKLQMYVSLMTSRRTSGRSSMWETSKPGYHVIWQCATRLTQHQFLYLVDLIGKTELMRVSFTT